MPPGFGGVLWATPHPVQVGGGWAFRLGIASLVAVWAPDPRIPGVGGAAGLADLRAFGPVAEFWVRHSAPPLGAGW